MDKPNTEVTRYTIPVEQMSRTAGGNVWVQAKDKELKYLAWFEVGPGLLLELGDELEVVIRRKEVSR